MEVKEIDLNGEIEKLIREAQNSTSYEALTFITKQLLNLLILKQRELYSLNNKKNKILKTKLMVFTKEN